MKTTILKIFIITGLLMFSGNSSILPGNDISAASIDAINKLYSMGIDVSKEEFFKHTREGNVDAIKLFFKTDLSLESRNETGETPLIVAAAAGHDYILRMFIENGGNVNAKTKDGETALMAAIMTAKDSRISTVRTLIKAGADVNAKDAWGWTALWRAVGMNNIPIARELVQAGADVNAETNDGRSPLELAISKNNPELIRVLKKLGKDNKKIK